MTYEQLMAHATEIQRCAVETADPRAAGQFTDVPGRFAKFTGLTDPAAFDGSLRALDTVLSGLSTGQEPAWPANPVLQRVAAPPGWTGPAAEAFRIQVADPFPAMVRNQFGLAMVLRNGIEAQRQLWHSARSDVDQIAEKTIVALHTMHACSRNEWTITFTVVASLAAMVAVPLAGGAALAAASVGGAAQVAAAVAPEDPVTNEFSGDSSYAVVDRMRDALTLLGGHIYDRETALSRALQRAFAVVAADRTRLAP